MPTTFFGWVGYILNQYGSLFVSGTVTTLVVALTGTVLGFGIGLLVAIARSTEASTARGPRGARSSGCPTAFWAFTSRCSAARP
jgi:ABC-type amino acid transport system permease subunit